MQTVKIRPTKRQKRSTSGYAEQTGYFRARRSKGETDARKVIFGRGKFVGGASSLVSYEVSPLRGRS